jgi:hypothetical protein
VRQAVRPELFNRIDRVVPFLPLDRDAAARIALRTIELLRGRDGLSYRDLTFACDDEAVRRLAEQGYSAVYGARPLVRTVERAVVAPLAHRLNTYAGDIPLAATVGSNGVGDDDGGKEVDDGDELRKVGTESQPTIDVRPAVDTQARARNRNDVRTVLLRRAERAVSARRRCQTIEGSAAFLSLKNEHYQLEQLERRMAKLKDRGGKRSYEHLGKLTKLSRVVKAVGDMSAQTAALEDEILTALYGQSDVSPATANAWDETLTGTEGELYESALTMLRYRYAAPDRATLVIFGELPERVAQLARTYCEVVEARKSHVAVYYLLKHRDAPHRKPAGHLEIPVARQSAEQVEQEVLDALPVRDLSEWLDDPHERTFGAALQIAAVDAYPLLEDERGLHVFLDRGKHSSCLVDVSEQGLKNYAAPAGITRHGAIGLKPARRTHRLEARTFEEQAGKEQAYNALGDGLREWLEARLQRKAWEAVEPWK